MYCLNITTVSFVPHLKHLFWYCPAADPHDGHGNIPFGIFRSTFGGAVGAAGSGLPKDVAPASAPNDSRAAASAFAAGSFANTPCVWPNAESDGSGGGGASSLSSAITPASDAAASDAC